MSRAEYPFYRSQELISSHIWNVFLLCAGKPFRKEDQPSRQSNQSRSHPRIWRIQLIRPLHSYHGVSKLSDKSALELLRWQIHHQGREQEEKKISADPGEDTRMDNGLKLQSFTDSRRMSRKTRIIIRQPESGAGWSCHSWFCEVRQVFHAQESLQVHLSWKSASKLQIFALLSTSKQHLFLFIWCTFNWSVELTPFGFSSCKLVPARFSLCGFQTFLQWHRTIENFCTYSIDLII